MFCPVSMSPMSRNVPHLSEDAIDHTGRSCDTNFNPLVLGEIQAGGDSYSELIEKVDGDDRISRKRIESMKEKLEAKFEALQSRKDDLLTIGEIGIDQIIVDEAQMFRKLSFPSNMTSLKGVDPDGSQRAWDLFVKSRFTAEKNPGRALILASGTPISNYL